MSILAYYDLDYLHLLLLCDGHDALNYVSTHPAKWCPLLPFIEFNGCTRLLHSGIQWSLTTLSFCCIYNGVVAFPSREGQLRVHGPLTKKNNT